MEPGELQKRLGANLRAIREARGFSQESFAHEVMGFHRTHQSSLERGEENVSLGTLQKLATTLGVDPLDLLRRPDTNN